jgi:hypothetical protein
VNGLRRRGAAFYLGSSTVPEKVRRECLSGGKVLKAPANVVVLVATTARNVVICDPALAVKFMHVIEAATKTAFRNHYLHHERKLAGDSFR